MPQPTRYIEFEGVIKYVTAKAWQIVYEDIEGNTRTAWFAKSTFDNETQNIINEEDKTSDQVFAVANWAGKEKGIE